MSGIEIYVVTIMAFTLNGIIRWWPPGGASNVVAVTCRHTALVIDANVFIPSIEATCNVSASLLEFNYISV